ncbi:CAAX amino terminal protease self- immunity [Planctomycetes bacterium Pla163]|uniref:CAAX amino terminal protease self-immunity n=1 Tax=Rohdeia mirabilis TaxID=2528008 RepID=A0A518CW55_9BACT|nr:CAAX amino terminal protease self- immunity [Planctomycetes bacterium Pla163]
MKSQSNPSVFLIVVLVWTWAFSWTALTGQSKWNTPEGDTYVLLGTLGSMGFVPLAVLFALREGGWRTVVGFLGKTFIVPLQVKPWLLALVPAALILVGMFLGANLFWRGSWNFTPALGLGLLGILLFAWLEEVVWRGYALPRLLERYSPTGASLRLGLMWMLWHMPFFWVVGYSEWGPWGFLAWAPFYFVYTFYFTWLYQRSRGSVLVATVSHTAVNGVIQWFQPLSIENAGSLFAAGVLALFLFRKSRMDERSESVD